MTDPFTSDGAKSPPKPFTVEEGHRKVRSFVLRQGRFTPAQQRAFDELWPRFGLDYTGRQRDFDAAFGRIRNQGLPYWADPGQRQRGVINHRDGGRGLYFQDPDGHLLEIITRPYGSGT